MSVITQGFGGGNIIVLGFGDSAGGDGPFLVSARSLDAYTIEVVYSENVTDTALITANYIISPYLTVGEVVRITDSIYQIATSRQTAGEDYTITSFNVKDDEGRIE